MHGYLMHEKLYNKMKEKIDMANIETKRGKKADEDLNKSKSKQI